MISREHVVFEYGLTVEPDQMSSNTIYLDGVVRGPVVDNRRGSYSFDHHGEGLRMAMLATCQQVQVALELGLDPEGMSVVLNDLDADASLSLWLLRHPEREREPRVRSMVRDIGFVDAHGPVRPSTRLHRVLTHGHDEELNEDLLWTDQDHIEAWYRDGDEALPEPEPYMAAPAFGLTRDGELVEFDAVESFAALYDRDVVAGVVCPEAPDETVGYTVAKRSEFVRYDIEQFLNRMNQLEPGWGGASTIGGAPRGENGKRSELSVRDVRGVFVDVGGQMCSADEQ